MYGPPPLYQTDAAIKTAETILATPEEATHQDILVALQKILAVTRAQQALLKFREAICYTDDKGYLLQSLGIRIDHIEREIDPQALGVDEKYIREQDRLEREREKLEEKYRPKRKFPETQEERDRYYVADLCKPYNPAPDERDTFVFYSDIGALSGSSGYIRIRDGSVYGSRIYMRS
jgi:hypothetical protein